MIEVVSMTAVEVMVDVFRTVLVEVAVVVAVVPPGALNTTIDAVPTMTMIPMASTLTTAEIPNLPGLNNRRVGDREWLCALLDRATTPFIA